MLEVFRWALWAVLIVLAVPALVTGLGWAVSPSCETLLARGDRYNVAVVLGGGLHPDFSLAPAAIGRVEAGSALVTGRRAEAALFTGGIRYDTGPSEAAVMAAAARDLGVPSEAILIEDASGSTLQNALFSKPQIQAAGTFVLVTENFHMGRAYASFVWAGLLPDAVCLAGHDHDTSAHRFNRHHLAVTAKIVALEVPKFWFNLARGTVWHILNVSRVGSEDWRNGLLT